MPADITNPQSLNKYQYGYNNPLRYVDPNGHCIEDACILEFAAASALFAYTASPEGQQVIRNGINALLSTPSLIRNTFSSSKSESGQPATDAQSGNKTGPGSDANASEKTGPKAKDAPGVTAGGQATDEFGNKLGPSGKRQVDRTRSNTREAARNKALNEGSGAVEHRIPRQGAPHFHPTNNQGKKKPSSTHHEYPD